jgi:hypothetical protein
MVDRRQQRLRCLSACAVVELGKRLAIPLAEADWGVCTDNCDVVDAANGHRGSYVPASLACAATSQESGAA